MKPLVTFPDGERATVDILEGYLSSWEPTATVGSHLPANWSGSAPVHVQVQFDGTPQIHRYIAANQTIRVIVWSNSPTTSKRVASLCQGLLIAYAGGPVVINFRELTGPWVARDEDNRAELAAFTVRATVRSVPLVSP